MIRIALTLALLLAALTLGACTDPEAEAQARAQAQAAAAERAAGEAGAGFDAAVAEENWALAKAQADVLLARWPDTEVAARVRGEFDAVKAKADAVREQSRAAALWQYNVQEVKGGQQRSAAIYAREDIDTDGSGKRPVRLIFRDHPSWGRSSYLVLEAGDFACGRACRVPVSVDDGEPRRMAANRPVTDEAIAMFIEDEAALWAMTEGAQTLAIEFAVKAGGTRTAIFEVAGLDRARLPGWD